MKIVAKTEDGFLISATTFDVTEILRAVYGKVSDSIEIGQKIPAIDYATTITKLNQLSDNYSYTELLKEASSFAREVEKLKLVVEGTAKI